jgi:cytidylate kinase
MGSKGPGDSFPMNHLIERQMLLSRVRDHAEPAPPAAEPAGSYRFITLARDIGAHGDEVAAQLAEQLHWQVYDKEIVDYIARDSRVRQDLVRELDERSQNLIQDMVERLLLMAEGISFGNEEYHKALLKALAYLAARGGVVIVGRGGAYALQGERGLHLCVTAPEDVRVQRLAHQWQVRPEDARRRMQQVDTERRSFIQRHYRENVDDPRGYDAVFNSDRLSVAEIVRAVLGMMVLPAHEGQVPEMSRRYAASSGSDPTRESLHRERQTS